MGAYKKRIFYLDELRAIAIFAVILCHVANLFPYLTDSLKVAIPFFCSDLGRIGVPIFLMLSGALLLNREYELGSFFKRRFSRILIPFVFWVIVIDILKFFVFGDNITQIWDWSRGVGLTWYIYELIGLYLFIPVLNTFINKYNMKGVKYFLVLWIITLLLSAFNIKYFSHLKLQQFAGLMGYMVLGYYLVNIEFKINDKVMILLGSVMFIVFYIINCHLSLITADTTEYLAITMILQSVGVFLIFKHISSYSQKNSNSIITKVHNYIENGRIGKALVSISICSYGMYFVHYILCQTWKLFHPHSLKLIPVLLVVTIILSWIITLILSRIPYLENISGVK